MPPLNDCSVSQALLGAAKVERSGTVRRAYASSAAALARHAPDSSVRKLAAEAVQMYTEPGDRESRQLGGLILRELARSAADVFIKHAAQVHLGVFPLMQTHVQLLPVDELYYHSIYHVSWMSFHPQR